MTNEKILVTGSTGNVGVGLVQTLSKAGQNVTDDVECVTGRPVLSYESFASEFAQVFGVTE